MPRDILLACALALLGTVAPSQAQPDRRDDGPAAEVRVLLNAGDYDAAEARAESLLASSANMGGPDWLALRQAHLEARLRNGRGHDPHTLRLARDLVASSSKDGTSHRLLGEVLFEFADYGSALRAFLAAEGIDRSVAGPTSPAVAEDLERAALAYLWLDRFARASDAIDRAVKIEQTRPDGAGLARVLATRAFIWHRRGRYLESRSDLARALDIRQRVGLAHPESLNVLTLSGDQLWFDSDLNGARGRLTEAVTLAERSLREGHPALVECLRILAITLDDIGELDLAQRARERAVRIADAAYGVNHPRYALQLHDLALSFIKRGDYGEGRRLLQRAQAIYAARLGPTHSEVGSTLHNLGVLATNLGDLDEAVSLQSRAVAVWQRAVGAEHPWVPWALVSLADALASRGDHARALPITAQALATRERLLGPDHIQVAATLNGQARHLASLGRLHQARRVIDRSIGLWEASNAAEGLSDALLIRGRLEADRSRYAAAEADYRRALALRLPVFGTAHPSIGGATVSLATTLAGQSSPREALTLALEGERIAREHIRVTTGYLPERQALDYASTRERGLDLAVTFATSPAEMSRVFDGVIRGRAIVQDEMALRQRLRASASADHLEPLWANLTTASRRLANLAVRGPGGDDGAKYAGLLERARNDRKSAEARLAEHSAAVRRSLERSDTGIEELRAHLPDRAALVSYVRYDAVEFSRNGSRDRRRTIPSYAAFVLRDGQHDPILIHLGPASDIDTRIQHWRNHAIGSVTPSGNVVPGSEKVLRRHGMALRARIWDPIASALAGATPIYIVPDGALNLVPFGALPMDRSGYLVDGAPLHYMSAERDLVEYARPARSTGKGLLAIGGPDYGWKPHRRAHPAGPAPTVSQDGGSPEGRRSICGALEAVTFSALPASRLEANDVGGIWAALAQANGNHPAEILTGRRADEATFKRASPGRRVLHVATHGFFLGSDCGEGTARGRGVTARPSARPRPAPPRVKASDNPLLLSGLALAGANVRTGARPDDEDGVLTAEEVAALDLDGVEWAVLSACETGLGEIRGAEGVFGLRRAFKTAGARTVVMSLWPVEDRATRTWMRALYRARLQGRRATHDAMRDASQAVLSERRLRRQSTHPFFWAGFVAAGDWR